MAANQPKSSDVKEKAKGYSITSIDEHRKDSHRFIVQEAIEDDNSFVALNPHVMKELQIFRGDTILIKGYEKKDTICIALDHEACEVTAITMNTVVRNNLRVDIGDIVSVYQCADVEYGKRVHILPVKDTIESVTGNLLDEYLKPYFLEAYRPVREGDFFPVRGGMRTLYFKVIETDPHKYCLVAPDTKIFCLGEPVKREDDCIDEVGYDSIEKYISPYSGRTRISRLLFIASHHNNNPAMQLKLLLLAFNETKKGTDVKIMEKILNELDKFEEIDRSFLDEIKDWCDSILKNEKQVYSESENDLTFYRDLLSKLDKIKKEDTFLMKEIATCIDMHLGSAYGADEAWCVDIEKNLQTLIKGRICKGYNDIGDFYYAHGDIGSAINMYMKCRVYCTTLTETIKMRLNAILVCIELGQLRCLGTHLNRAGVDIKSHDPSVLAAVDPSLFVKLRCALALNYLYKKEYKLAAEKFIEISTNLGNQYIEVISARDVAIYGGLCALASFDSTELQNKVLDNTVFLDFLKRVPDVWELIVEFNKENCCVRPSKSLSKLKSILMLDIHLNSHVDTLYEQINQRAVSKNFELSLPELQSKINSCWTPDEEVADDDFLAGTYEELCGFYTDLGFFIEALKRSKYSPPRFSKKYYKKPKPAPVTPISRKKRSIKGRIEIAVEEIRKGMSDFTYRSAFGYHCANIGVYSQRCRIMAELCDYRGNLNGLNVIFRGDVTIFQLGDISVTLGPNGTTYSRNGNTIPKLA
ncbi:putative aspartate decarboxylase-like domain, CDC48 domain 2 [Medicago truncatula]|uniref:26S proteasome subunit RPN7 n=1 Tax=Medicago truncatula TaxID=3880 RepID=G7KP28_MEDTR|nr:uncharacterized protein LOC11413950 isoform X4 [Medicago truncatula]XP_039690893.1 uncharacterized protein LOC120575776 isoform X3 [Medicago truncatula]AES75092.2 26S proteasome subunit RPN7 [Medicago truncatula]RHN50658.1 putative aspartate decarboxylase-like domain, CDC48 domain 2 [Medicago truncatula]